ncbi:MAG TPA: hypothetical protein VHP63_04750 [candidate division Zixibacteria bacterium]|nr:hypothetical protein [candidate division Zixibacteria bacterium]
MSKQFKKYILTVLLVTLLLCCSCEENEPILATSQCCVGMRGNANDDEDDKVNILDLNYLALYVYRDGPAPKCMTEADVNCSGGVNPVDTLDVDYLVSFILEGGSFPCNCPQ